jgi:hypothetical protein
MALATQSLHEQGVCVQEESMLRQSTMNGQLWEITNIFFVKSGEILRKSGVLGVIYRLVRLFW